jgi:dolichol-phosphate mannosyltransferase
MGFGKKYEYIFEMDADFSHNPNDLERLYIIVSKDGADLLLVLDMLLVLML